VYGVTCREDIDIVTDIDWIRNEMKLFASAFQASAMSLSPNALPIVVLGAWRSNPVG
jgi:hypothetical protein